MSLPESGEPFGRLGDHIGEPLRLVPLAEQAGLYELRGDAVRLGRLLWPTDRRAQVEADSAEGRWVFGGGRGLLRWWVTAHRMPGGYEEGYFASRRLRLGGQIVVPGAEAVELAQVSPLRQSWEIRPVDEGGLLVRFDPARQSPWTLEIAVAHAARQLPRLPLVVLLGGYVVLLENSLGGSGGATGGGP